VEMGLSGLGTSFVQITQLAYCFKPLKDIVKYFIVSDYIKNSGILKLY